MKKKLFKIYDDSHPILRKTCEKVELPLSDELSKLLKICVFKGMDEDTLNIFKGAYRYKSGKYYEALRNI